MAVDINVALSGVSVSLACPTDLTPHSSIHLACSGVSLHHKVSSWSSAAVLSLFYLSVQQNDSLLLLNFCVVQRSGSNEDFALSFTEVEVTEHIPVEVAAMHTARTMSNCIELLSSLQTHDNRGWQPFQGNIRAAVNRLPFDGSLLTSFSRYSADHAGLAETITQLEGLRRNQGLSRGAGLKKASVYCSARRLLG